MANATSIPVTELTANGSIVQPAAAGFDTGSTAVTVPCAVGGRADRVILIVGNTDDDTALSVVIKAGAKPPAMRAGVGDLTVTVAFGTTRVIGPFDPSRFLKADGSLSVVLTPASGTIAANARCYAIPKSA